MKQTLILSFLTFFAASAHAADQMRMAVTTSFHNSGLADIKDERASVR